MVNLTKILFQKTRGAELSRLSFVLRLLLTSPLPFLVYFWPVETDATTKLLKRCQKSIFFLKKIKHLSSVCGTEWCIGNSVVLWDIFTVNLSRCFRGLLYSVDKFEY